MPDSMRVPRVENGKMIVVYSENPLVDLVDMSGMPST